MPRVTFFVIICLALSVGIAGCEADSSLSDDPCSLADCGPGSCIEDSGQALCICPEGMISGGLSCIDDPCDPDPCAYGSCRISGAVVYCQCDEGYGGEFCDRCADGYMPVGNACLPGDACDSDPCVFGICSVVDGVETCTCHSGYTGQYCDRCADGFIPIDLRCVSSADPCSPNPCVHGSCREQDGLPVCQCDIGYAGNWCDSCDEGYEAQGAVCVPVSGDPCDPNPCIEEHRTICLDNGGTAVCTCDPGYVFDGEACVEESTVDPCNPNPCNQEHRSQCISEGDTYSCLCDDGYREDESGDCVEDSTSIEARNCGVTIRYRSSSAGPIYVRGELNSWGLSDEMQNNSGVWEITIDVSPGDYGYKLYDASSDDWFLDPNNPYTKYIDGEQNSRLRMPDCSAPLLQLDAPPAVDGSRISFAVAAYYGRQRYALDEASAKVWRNGESLDVDFDSNTGVFVIEDDDLDYGKYGYRIEISDVQGNAAKPLFVPVWLEEEAFDWRDGSMYFVLTDRFADGAPSNNAPVSDGELDFKANWQGGDFIGIRSKIQDGYFSDMGINVLWISSPIMNTQGAFWGSDGHKYTGYHSYWPISTGWTGDDPIDGVQVTDPHFGPLSEFKEMVDAAHAAGIRVLVDFVANHVHSDSPVYQDHIGETEPWFHWSGSAGNGYVCGWERPIECWFAEYLPDFEYKNPEVMKMVMDHAIWLIQETNIDGFRLDAVKHMILDFSRTIRARIDDEIDVYDGIRFYMVGETFTGEGDGARQTIKQYVGKDLLDGQFDFPLFWMVLKAFLRHEAGLDGLKSFMDGNDGYYGPDAVMSTFIGNHDVPRALSHAAGDIGDMWGNGSKEQGWSNPPGSPSWDDPYKRLRQAWTFLFTQPMIPLIYYGDEIGLPGAGDPDNRRFMRFSGDLNARERATLEHVAKVGRARSGHSALRTGQRHTLSVDASYWAYVMKDSDEQLLVVFNRDSARSENLNVGSAGMADGNYKDVISGNVISVSGGRVDVSLGSLESAIYERD